jgi:hypothetical protein
MLLLGRAADPLFLQSKKSGPSVLEEFLGPSEYENCGQRVVVIQQLMQTVASCAAGPDAIGAGRIAAETGV